MLKRVFLLTILAFTFACNMQVMYKDGESKNSDIAYSHELAAIVIKKDRIRLNQELKNNLYDILNPDYIKAEPKYFLTIELAATTSSTFITVTGSSGRNSVTITAKYKLQDLETGKEISSGSTIASDNYDVTANRFGSYTAEEYIKSNLTKIVAQNIRNSLVNDIIEMKKKKEKEASEAEDQKSHQ